MSLRLFAFFHLNLAFSSIEVEDRPRVVAQAYWPLIKLAESRGLPFAIEATAWTLETIKEIDPALFEKIKELVTDGPCEFIGSGYAQIIGPLVPAAVNEANQRIGIQNYKDLLGITPSIALINEQAYAGGLLTHYQKAGYKAIIMEWDNPSRTHPEWPYEARYHPAYALGADGELLPVIWNHSIAFQKVQRYAHGDIDLDGYMSYLRERDDPGCDRVLSMYGNDVEVFDFRPGRFMTEAPLHHEGEWSRLEKMFGAVQDADDLEIVSVSSLLSELGTPDDINTFRLETADQPIPVKKQAKYNILRWAVSGRNDLAINTACWQIYNALQGQGSTNQEDWTELLYLWSSDFRTHITESRWDDYSQRLKAMQKRLATPAKSTAKPRSTNSLFEVGESEHLITLSNDRLTAAFNKSKGLALDHFIDRNVSDVSCIGTLHHGYFDDIQWGADFFSGHMVYARPGDRKVTDLEATTPEIQHFDDGVSLSASFDLPIGRWIKRWTIGADTGELSISYELTWAKDIDRGSFRFGFITLNPAFFDAASLCFETHNGGYTPEKFELDDRPVDHGQALSLFISAGHGLGMTEGLVRMHDAHHGIEIEMDNTASALIGFVTHQPTSGTHFTRLEFSAQEIDDTFKDLNTKGDVLKAEIKIRAVKAPDA